LRSLCCRHDADLASWFADNRNCIHRRGCGVTQVNQYWVAVLGTSAIAFALKYSGHSVPEKWLSHPKIQKVNALIPIALLSALVAAQTFTEKSKLMIDHRLLGLAVAIIALLLKAPFPVVVLSAAVSSALLYNFSN
jgi:branched-subunit amino acid transport protein